MNSTWTTPTVIAAAAAALGLVFLKRRASAASLGDDDGELEEDGSVTRGFIDLPPDTSAEDLTGSAFIAAATPLSAAAREDHILDWIDRGATPASWRELRPVTVRGGGHEVTFYAAPDVVTLGTDSDRFRPALTAGLAQRIADRLGMSLPTATMVDAIHAQADVRVPFRGFSGARDSFATHVASNAAIEQRLAGRSGLISDHSKDYVVGYPRRRWPEAIAIYGGWDSQGTRVQPPSGGVHYLGYRDYSQRARLIGRTVLVDGQQRQLAEALADPAIAPLLHREGVVTNPSHLRYPT